MNDILVQWIPWGYQLLLQIEQWRTPALDTLFTYITELGGEWFYIVFLSILYWSINKRVSLGVAYVYLTSTFFNSVLKTSFAIPRPDSPEIETTLGAAQVEDRLRPLFFESSYAWPSNHSQGAIVTWGYLAWKVGRRWFTVAAAVLIALIAFSRLYGGVHYPQDVIGGLLIGALFLVLWVYLEPQITAQRDRISFGLWLLAAAGVPILALLLNPVPDTAMAMGTISGMGAGFLFQERFCPFDSGGVWWKRVLRALVGLAITLTWYLGFRSLLAPLGDSSLAVPIRAFRYGSLGLVATVAVPWIFIRIGLAERE